jgi:thioredoxin reductase
MVDGEVIPGVFNTTTDIIPKLAKDQPAIVVYNNAADAKFALEVADKYKQVYLCSDKIDIKNELTKTIAKKLAETENIAILPNTKIKKAITEKGVLQKVELDNYSVINCSAIFVKTNTAPAIDFIPKKLIPRDDNGYLAVAGNAESSLVPKCFAVGNCIQKYTKAMGQNLVETILKDF